jgi:desampylase
VDQAIPAHNVLASPQRYEIAPEMVLAADRAARAAGRVLLGAWHSHPGGRAVPSAQDLEEAWPDWCYLIVGLADAARPELRAWRLLGEDFVEDALELQ